VQISATATGAHLGESSTVALKAAGQEAPQSQPIPHDLKLPKSRPSGC